jgi:hypothetical protein
MSSDSSPIPAAGDDGEILSESTESESNGFAGDCVTCYQRGQEQAIWSVHQSPEWEAGPAGRKHTVRWTLQVAADGVVSTSRSVPYSGQRCFSTEDRPNRADKSSEYRLSVEEVLGRHAALCSKRGDAVSVDTLRECVQGILALYNDHE